MTWKQIKAFRERRAEVTGEARKLLAQAADEKAHLRVDHDTEDDLIAGWSKTCRCAATLPSQSGKNRPQAQIRRWIARSGYSQSRNRSTLRGFLPVVASTSVCRAGVRVVMKGPVVSYRAKASRPSRRRIRG